jgi:hypothetical protein
VAVGEVDAETAIPAAEAAGGETQPEGDGEVAAPAEGAAAAEAAAEAETPAADGDTATPAEAEPAAGN